MGLNGNHGGEVLLVPWRSWMATTSSPRRHGLRGLHLHVPSCAFRGYGEDQALSIESAIDELGRKLRIDPFTMRRKNMIRLAIPYTASVLPGLRRDRQLWAQPAPDLVEPAPPAQGRGIPDENDAKKAGVAIHGQRRDLRVLLLQAHRPAAQGTYHLRRPGSSAMASGTRSGRSPPPRLCGRRPNR